MISRWTCWTILGLILCFLFSGCQSGSSSDPSPDPTESINITDVVLTNTSALCLDYVGSYSSSVTDILNNESFSGSFTISISDAICQFSSNSIPNHNFNDSSTGYVNDIRANVASFTIDQTPTAAGTVTALTLDTDNAVFLNGVKLDLLAAACFGVKDGKTGCGDISAPWRYDPMFSGNDFGADSHNAHTQPDGTYHYHGSPVALFQTSNTSISSPVIGFAADGFPIYGSYFNENDVIVKAISGYTLKSGDRQSQAGESGFPGGNYDGTFVDDYEFTSAGNLDQCNGRTVDGQYGYYVTDSYPWVLGCFKGTPNTTFRK